MMNTHALEPVLDLLTSTENLLRGLAFDPRIPDDVKVVLRTRAGRLAAAVDALTPMEDDDE